MKADVEVAYNFLGLKYGTPLKIVKEVRSRRIIEAHPDKVGSEERLDEAKKINWAYDTIKKWLSENPEKIDWNTGSEVRESSELGGFMNVNHGAYIDMLSRSNYFNNSTVTQNREAMFDLIYRLYNKGYGENFLERIRRENYRPNASPDSFVYEGAFPGLFNLFGSTDGHSLTSHFQLFKLARDSGYDPYSHILIYFDAEMTKQIGLPRFRVFLFGANSDSVDEMLALYRNHNNEHPRFQFFQMRHLEALYGEDRWGNRFLIEAAHDDISPIDFSILDMANPNPPKLVGLGEDTELDETSGVKLKDLGKYLSPVGMRFLRIHQGLNGDFGDLYAATSAKDVVEEMERYKILKRIANANPKHLLWPREFGQEEIDGEKPDDFCETALKMDSEKPNE